MGVGSDWNAVFYVARGYRYDRYDCMLLARSTQSRGPWTSRSSFPRFSTTRLTSRACLFLSVFAEHSDGEPLTGPLPLCRLQPVKDTRDKQILLWCDLILKYCRHHKVQPLTRALSELQGPDSQGLMMTCAPVDPTAQIFIISTATDDEFPLFVNKVIDRKLNTEARSTFLQALVDKSTPPNPTVPATRPNSRWLFPPPCFHNYFDRGSDRAEWLDGSTGKHPSRPTQCLIWWRPREEWPSVITRWVCASSLIPLGDYQMLL